MPARDYIHNFLSPSNDPRHHLKAPVRSEGRLYASDGSVLIVTDDDDTVTVNNDRTLAIMARSLLQKMDAHTHWAPVDIALPEPLACKHCNGIGKMSECPECDGGFVEDGLDETTCPKCNGKFEWPDANGGPCWYCGGTGEALQTVPFENTLFARRYLALLQALPGPVLLSPGPVFSDVAFFRFAEGFGAVMPCRR